MVASGSQAPRSYQSLRTTNGVGRPSGPAGIDIESRLGPVRQQRKGAPVHVVEPRHAAAVRPPPVVLLQ